MKRCELISAEARAGGFDAGRRCLEYSKCPFGPGAWHQGGRLARERAEIGSSHAADRPEPDRRAARLRSPRLAAAARGTAQCLAQVLTRSTPRGPLGAARRPRLRRRDRAAGTLLRSSTAAALHARRGLGAGRPAQSSPGNSNKAVAHAYPLPNAPPTRARPPCAALGPHDTVLESETAQCYTSSVAPRARRAQGQHGCHSV